MTEQPTTGLGTDPTADPEDNATGWLKKNWWKALLGSIGGAMLFMGGGEMMILLGLLLVAVAAVAILKPDMMDKAGEFMGGLRDKAAERIPQLQITKDDLATKQADIGKMSGEEKTFEQWALSEEVLAKLDEQDKRHLRTILDKMRSGADGEKVKLSEKDVADFVNGLENNAITAQDKEALKAAAQNQLAGFR